MHDETSGTGQPLEEVTAVLKALTDPNRLRVFKALMRGASCNRWLTEELDLPANLLSHHLKVFHLQRKQLVALSLLLMSNHTWCRRCRQHSSIKANIHHFPATRKWWPKT